MVGEHFEIYLSQKAKSAFKLSTMIGENFEIYLSQMTKSAFKFKFKFTSVRFFCFVFWIL